MRVLTAVIVLAISIGCRQAPTAPTTTRPTRITIAPGVAARIDGTSLTIRFDGVLSDSRCPSDAICIHQGDAEVALATVVAGHETAHTLLVNDRSRSAVVRDGYVVSLELLSPYPTSVEPILADAYRATFLVTRP